MENCTSDLKRTGNSAEGKKRSRMDTNDVQVVVVDAKVSSKKSKPCCDVLCKRKDPDHVTPIHKMIKILVIGRYLPLTVKKMGNRTI